MKLLFDHNLSPRLVNRLAELYPDSNHLFNLNLDTAEELLFGNTHGIMILP